MYLTKVLNYTSAKLKTKVFISLLEMSNVYDLVGQPLYTNFCLTNVWTIHLIHTNMWRISRSLEMRIQLFRNVQALHIAS